MGCDIHIFAEKKNEQGAYEAVDCPAPFDDRSYGVFGFLAGVRNYSAVTPISAPRGLPADASPEVREEHESWSCDAHSASWLTVEELLAFDYEAQTEDRRVAKRMPGGWIDGGCTAEPGGGTAMTYRKFLGEWFFNDLEDLKSRGVDRVVFWFDN